MVANRRGGRGKYPKKAESTVLVRRGAGIPEYLVKEQVDALISCAPHPRAALLFLLQFRAGLRISEALALEIGDITLDVERPTLRVRHGKGNKTRLVPVHPELAAAVRSTVMFGGRKGTLIKKVDPATAWRWIQTAMSRAVDLKAIPPGRRIGTHTLRHSAARHWLMDRVQINDVQLWLGHASLQTTLIYLKLMPDPTGSMDRVS